MPEPLQPGRVLGGRYRLEREIARGGMGTVWEADDPLLARQIAVKTLDTAIGMDESIRARFRREAVTAAAVTHPNIVATYDTGEDDGVAYIVMELVHGITLRQLIDRDGALPVGDAAGDHLPGRRRALGRARARARAPRRQARQRPRPTRRAREGHRLRHRQGGRQQRRGAHPHRDGGRHRARTSRPSRSTGATSTSASTSTRSGSCSTRCCAARRPFEADTDIATAVARLTDAAAIRSASSARRCRPGSSTSSTARSTKDPADRWPSALAFRDAVAPFRTDATPAGRGRTRPCRCGSRPGALRSPHPRRGARTPRPGTSPAHPGPDRALDRGLRRSACSPATSGYRAIDDQPVVERRTADARGRPADDRRASATTTRKATDARTRDQVAAHLGRQRRHGLVDRAVQGPRRRRAEVRGRARRRPRRPEAGRAGRGRQPRRATGARQVYTSNSVPDAIAGWGPPRFNGSGLGTDAQLELQPGREARNVLLWITNLPPTRPYRLRVAEVRVIGSA